MRVIEFSTFSADCAGGGALRIIAQKYLGQVIERAYFGFDNNSVDHELGYYTIVKYYKMILVRIFFRVEYHCTTSYRRTTLAVGYFWQVMSRSLLFLIILVL